MSKCCLSNLVLFLHMISFSSIVMTVGNYYNTSPRSLPNVSALNLFVLVHSLLGIRSAKSAATTKKLEQLVSLYHSIEHIRCFLILLNFVYIFESYYSLSNSFSRRTAALNLLLSSGCLVLFHILRRRHSSLIFFYDFRGVNNE